MKRIRSVQLAWLVVLLLGAGAAWAAGAGSAWPAAASTPGIEDPADPGMAADDAGLETAAICRMAPECWTDADCDARCGVGLGNCVRNKCPVKICKC